MKKIITMYDSSDSRLFSTQRVLGANASSISIAPPAQIPDSKRYAGIMNLAKSIDGGRPVLHADAVKKNRSFVESLCLIRKRVFRWHQKVKAEVQARDHSFDLLRDFFSQHHRVTSFW